MLKESFETFVTELEVDNEEDMMSRYKRILKKLNGEFWGEESEEEHGYIVGSLGRRTAIKGISDMDMLFVLPTELKAQYDGYEENGQSTLLQDVKKVIKKIYPRTVVRGDGQVVVVTMNGAKCEIEVCPVFERTDGAFDYPDTNNGGRWRKTDPLPELAASEVMTDESSGHFIYICRMVRAWKNNKGFKLGGLLIDTLVHNFLNDDKYAKYKDSSFESYLDLYKDLFSYLKNMNKEQSYWLALGSRQHVYNKDGAFVAKAKKAYGKLKDLTEESEELYDNLRSVFGNKFPLPEAENATQAYRESIEISSARKTEEFIDEKFDGVDIKYNLKIDCDVEVKGFTRKSLRSMLSKFERLQPRKQLTFMIKENEFEELALRTKDPDYNFRVYWKVLNRGSEAIRRNQIRGQIFPDAGMGRRQERTSFRGGHIVECYVVHNNVVVAKDRIKVPIESSEITA
ncbi:nucleotide-binding domain-containing protein [Paenibacillus polymyxa]|uniref:nucleotide-binding domain-containing protein n=1 Tax=Paenibacillus polymyxa TaxID=1406 RepID=UPI0011180DEC|nr:nucleotidyltransferase [Paenibacillus polymyxa]QDA30252.1 nucleotidyltransferase [Paenibacillus polymyxa]